MVLKVLRSMNNSGRGSLRCQECDSLIGVWGQINGEGIEVARCMIERLMKRLGLQGANRVYPITVS